MDENPDSLELKGQQTVKSIVNSLFCLSTMAFPLVLVISPTFNVWMHSIPFLQMIFFQWLAVACNYWVNRAKIRTREAAFFVGLTLSCTMFISLAAVDLFAYDVMVAEERAGNWTATDYDSYHSEAMSETFTSRPLEPLLPPWLMQVINIVWLLFQGNIRRYLPDSPCIAVDFHLLTEEEVEGLVAGDIQLGGAVSAEEVGKGGGAEVAAGAAGMSSRGHALVPTPAPTSS